MTIAEISMVVSAGFGLLLAFILFKWFMNRLEITNGEVIDFRNQLCADCGEELPPLDESILKNATYSCLALCDTCFKQEQQRIKDIDPDTLPF